MLCNRLLTYPRTIAGISCALVVKVRRSEIRYSATRRDAWSRRAMFLIVCVVALVATTACGKIVYTGVGRIVAEEDGELLSITRVAPEDWENLYLSVDGGKTWAYTDRRNYSPVLESSESVHTPRGTFSLDGPDVVLTSEDGLRNVVYSSANWNTDAHLWLQSKISDPYDVWLATEPSNVIYHKQSGNVILAALGRGVIVGTPDGHWTPVPVGPYRMADFSPLAKTQALLSDRSFWMSILVLALSFTLLALALSASVRSEMAIAITGVSAGVSLLPILPFGIVNLEWMDRNLLYDTAQVIFLFIAYPCAVVATFVCLSQLGRWREWAPALTLMILVVLGVFVAWIQTGIPLPLAKLLAVGLVILITCERSIRLMRPANLHCYENKG